MKIYGPYTRSDGRKHIVIIHPNGRKQTKSYPKYLLEQKLGRDLLPNETCDHIDNDFTNNNINNLQVLTRTDNIIKAVKPRKTITFNCPICGKLSTKYKNNVDNNIKRGKAGPFCSRQCAGKYSTG